MSSSSFALAGPKADTVRIHFATSSDNPNGTPKAMPKRDSVGAVGTRALKQSGSFSPTPPDSNGSTPTPKTHWLRTDSPTESDAARDSDDDSDEFNAEHLGLSTPLSTSSTPQTKHRSHDSQIFTFAQEGSSLGGLGGTALFQGNFVSSATGLTPAKQTSNPQSPAPSRPRTGSFNSSGLPPRPREGSITAGLGISGRPVTVSVKVADSPPTSVGGGVSKDLRPNTPAGPMILASNGRLRVPLKVGHLPSQAQISELSVNTADSRPSSAGGFYSKSLEATPVVTPAGKMSDKGLSPATMRAALQSLEGRDAPEFEPSMRALAKRFEKVWDSIGVHDSAVQLKHIEALRLVLNHHLTRCETAEVFARNPCTVAAPISTSDA